MEKTKTGEVYYRDEDGTLHFAVSYVDKDGVSYTEDSVVNEA